MKLMDKIGALRDADKCIELDPSIVQAYVMKGTILHQMEEYYKALKTYEDGLNIDSSNEELVDGKNKTIEAIRMIADASKQNVQE